MVRDKHLGSLAAAGAQALRQLRLEWHPEQHAARLQGKAQELSRKGPGIVSEGSVMCCPFPLPSDRTLSVARLHWRLVRPAPLGVLAPQLLALLFQQRLQEAPRGSAKGSRLCRRCRDSGASLPGATTRRGAEDAAAAEDGVASSGAAPSPSGVASVVSLRPPEMSCWRNLRHSSGLGPEAGGSAAHSAGAPQRVVRVGSSLRVEQAGTERRRSAALDGHIHTACYEKNIRF